MYRRVTITAVIVGIVVLLVVGFYLVYTASTKNDALIGQPVSDSDLASLRQLSLPPYGPSGSGLLSDVKNYTGSPLTVNGKPLVVYIGADYCPYCSIQRWVLVLSLERFGNFTNLIYMASSQAEGDYATFTFSNITYTSKYISFQAFENRDRNNQPLQTVPANYTSVWSQYGSEYPFANFGNRYIIPASLLLPNDMAGKSWADILASVAAGDSLGTQIKEATNVMTALVCKVTNNQPTSVCSQSPINGLVISIEAFVPPSAGYVSQAFSVQPTTPLAVVPYIAPGRE